MYPQVIEDVATLIAYELQASLCDRVREVKNGERKNAGDGHVDDFLRNFATASKLIDNSQLEVEGLCFN